MKTYKLVIIQAIIYGLDNQIETAEKFIQNYESIEYGSINFTDDEQTSICQALERVS